MGLIANLIIEKQNDLTHPAFVKYKNLLLQTISQCRLIDLLFQLYLKSLNERFDALFKESSSSVWEMRSSFETMLW